MSEAQLPIVFTCSAATAASMTEAVDLGGSYNKLWVLVPSMTCYGADTQIFPLGSADGSTFKRIAERIETSALISNVPLYVASAVSNMFVHIDTFGFRWIKLETTAVVTTPTAVFKIVASAQ